MAKLLPLLSSTIVSIGAPGIVGSYHLTKESIWDQVSEDVVPVLENPESDTSIKNVWEKLKTNLSSKQKPQENIETSDNLKQWCLKSYKETYRSWFQKENTKLKEDVKSICVYTIEEQLGNNKITIPEESSNTNEAEFKKKISTLKEHKDHNVPLEEDLIKIQSSSNPESEWKKLEEWCKKTYKRGYQGEKTIRWKLAETYCKKSN